MPTHVALLRGINVGGHNRVAMADQRSVVSSLGHTDVATYIQSGNVVLTRDELAQAVAANPYPDEANPKCLHAAFRMEEPGPDEAATVAAAVDRARAKGSRDEAEVGGAPCTCVHPMA